MSYVAIIGSLVLGPVVKDHLSRTSFDPVAWRDRTLIRTDRGLRVRMVDDLLATHDFHGMTADDVVRFLGPPDTGSSEELEYLLGPERSTFSIDYEILVFRLNERGEVKSCRVVTG